MSGTTDYIKVPGRIQTGPGNLFIGPKNTVLTSYATRTQFNHVGYCTGGEVVNSLGEDYIHEGGAPLRANKMEVTKQGITVTLNIAEPAPHISGLMGYGHGATSSVDENTTTAFTSQEVYLHGYGYAKLPYHDITITSIATSDATPITYDPAGIATNFTYDSVKGTLKANETGDESPEEIDGTLYYITGTWNKPLENILTIGSVNTYEKDYYSVLYLPDIADGYTNGIFIPKASAIDYATRTYKVGEERLDTMTFRSIKDRTMAYEWCEIEEIS